MITDHSSSDIQFFVFASNSLIEGIEWREVKMRQRKKVEKGSGKELMISEMI